jgi:phosphatidylinositol alpha-mannosyltransferase
MKIGLVTPYVYPLPGGVNDHVGHLYEALRARGHDVRILTASHGLQRSSEGDVIRIGKGFSVPSNGSMGTLTV